jgi:hypothetical protein
MLLSEWLVDHWLPVHNTRVKKTTYRAYRSAIVHHINPRSGGVAIGKLNHRCSTTRTSSCWSADAVTEKAGSLRRQ